MTYGHNTWTVQVPATEVLSAAMAKQAYHQSRLDHWLARQSEADAELRAKGVSFRSADARYRNTSVAGAVDVVIDPQLQRQLSEINLKVDQHSGLVEEYRRWAEFLKRATGNLDCDANTFKLFGIGAAINTTTEEDSE